MADHPTDAVHRAEVTLSIFLRHTLKSSYQLAARETQLVDQWMGHGNLLYLALLGKRAQRAAARQQTSNCVPGIQWTASDSPEPFRRANAIRLSTHPNRRRRAGSVSAVYDDG
jgi:hypothetical protein